MRSSRSATKDLPGEHAELRGNQESGHPDDDRRLRQVPKRRSAKGARIAAVSAASTQTSVIVTTKVVPRTPRRSAACSSV